MLRRLRTCDVVALAPDDAQRDGRRDALAAGEAQHAGVAEVLRKPPAADGVLRGGDRVVDGHALRVCTQRRQGEPSTRPKRIAVTLVRPPARPSRQVTTRPRWVTNGERRAHNPAGTSASAAVARPRLASSSAVQPPTESPTTGPSRSRVRPSAQRPRRQSQEESTELAATRRGPEGRRRSRRGVGRARLAPAPTFGALCSCHAGG